MEHILITSDLSEAAASAYTVAREQAEAIGQGERQLTLLYVSEDMIAATFDFGLGVDPNTIMEELEQQAREKLLQIEQQYFSGLLVNSVVLRAIKPISVEIADFARSRKVDLIITATHGRTGFAHALQGSVAEKLLRLSHCPIMIVPSVENDQKE